jgi:ABC-2 type transport system ATP-binding protein
VPPAVVVEDLTKRFGALTAVAGMSWAADRGQVTAVLGPNGAGKTTAIGCLEGLLRPEGGQARVLGVDPWDAGADHRARVGVMLQDGGLPNTASPARILAHLSRLYAAPLPLAPLADRLGITAFRRTPLRRLSGGQRQRVALAAALIGRPEVAFLDEPTSGLDPHARLEVWDLIRGERDRGCAVVVTTHSFEEAQRLADHVVIVDMGRAVADGTIAQVAGAEGLESVYFALTGRRRDGR